MQTAEPVDDRTALHPPSLPEARGDSTADELGWVGYEAAMPWMGGAALTGVAASE